MALGARNVYCPLFFSVSDLSVGPLQQHSLDDLLVSSFGRKHQCSPTIVVLSVSVELVFRKTEQIGSNSYEAGVGSLVEYGVANVVGPIGVERNPTISAF